MQKRRGSSAAHWLVSLWLMVRVLARLNGTDRPMVEISINTEAEASTGIPLRLMLVELAQRELHQQRFVTWEQVGVYTETGVPVDAALGRAGPPHRPHAEIICNRAGIICRPHRDFAEPTRVAGV